MKQCPFCGHAVILLSTASFLKGDDDAYKIICQCGWAARQMHGWYPNKAKLIEKWNSYINDVNEI